MSVMQGHENLKPRKILGFSSDGKALVDFGDDGLKRYDMFVTPSGTIRCSPEVQPAESGVNGVDQIGGAIGKRSLAEKMAMVDQGGS